MTDNYFEERNNKNILKMREIVDSFPEFANEFFLGIQLRTSALTRLNYAHDIRIFFDYLIRFKFRDKTYYADLTILDIENLTAFDIEKFLDYLTLYKFNGKQYKCGEKAKERKLCTLRSFFKYYFKKDKLTKNVTTKVDLPKIHEKPIVTLESDEVSRLLDIVDVDTEEFNDNVSEHQSKFLDKTKIRDSAILTLFLGTGIRISELVGLNRDDFNFKNNSFLVTRKGGNKSILYFSDEVADSLKRYMDWLIFQEESKSHFGRKIKDANALFLSIQGKRISIRAVEDLVKKYSIMVSPLKKISPHKLRSTYGTSLYRETQDIYVVADVLGHKDINTTKKHYASMSDTIRKNAAQKVKLRDVDN